MQINRRQMLGMMAAGSAGLLCPQLITSELAFAAFPDLSVVKGPDPAACVREAVKGQGGMSHFVSKGDVVVIKPNMGFGNPPSWASSTEPAVMRALAELALQAGAKRVMIFDNPCGKVSQALEQCGIQARVKDLHDTFVFIAREERFFRSVELPKAKVLTKTEIAKDILEADTIINVPIAKSHGSAMVTFGMKNWMGVVRDRRPFHAHYNLHQAIADMATFIKPKLTVLDATRALVTGGPGGPGQVQLLQTIVAGTDVVALDAYATTMAKWSDKGYRPDEIPYIVNAYKMGLGRMSLDQLNISKTTLTA